MSCCRCPSDPILGWEPCCVSKMEYKRAVDELMETEKAYRELETKYQNLLDKFEEMGVNIDEPKKPDPRDIWLSGYSARRRKDQ